MRLTAKGRALAANPTDEAIAKALNCDMNGYPYQPEQNPVNPTKSKKKLIAAIVAAVAAFAAAMWGIDKELIGELVDAFIPAEEAPLEPGSAE